jgi:hypothetical protein
VTTRLRHELRDEASNAAGRAHDQDRLTRQRSEGFHQLERGATRCWQRGGNGVIEPSWQSRERRILRYCDPLRESSGRSKWRDYQMPIHIVAWRESASLRAAGFDDASQVDAQDHGEDRRHPRRPPTAGDGVIHRIHTRGAYPNEDLPRADLGVGNFSYGGCCAVLADGDCLHRNLLSGYEASDLLLLSIASAGADGITSQVNRPSLLLGEGPQDDRTR